MRAETRGMKVCGWWFVVDGWCMGKLFCEGMNQGGGVVLFCLDAWWVAGIALYCFSLVVNGAYCLPCTFLP